MFYAHFRQICRAVTLSKPLNLWLTCHIEHKWPLVKYNIYLKIDKIERSVSKWRLISFIWVFGWSHPSCKISNLIHDYVGKLKIKLKYRHISKDHIKMAALSISADFQQIFFVSIRLRPNDLFNVLIFGIKSYITIIKIELLPDIDPINRFEMVMVSRSADLSNFPT